MDQSEEGKVDPRRMELITLAIMKKLSPSQPNGQQLFRVRPRWPNESVWISEAAYEALNTAQRIISQQRDNMILILTRGHEMDSKTMKAIRFAGRKIVSFIFKVLNRNRPGEADIIFSANGHDDGTGNHIDVAIEVHGKRLILLPNGPFASVDQIENIKRQYMDMLVVVYEALNTAGFSIHGNSVEALQIHCDLREAKGK